MKIIKADTIAEYIGQQSEPSPWHTVTQEQINQFADCTLDHQFIHVDPEAAKNGPFGTTIAHGFLSLSMLSHFAESTGLIIDGAHTFINYGFDKVRFLTPVKVDSKIRATATVISLVEKNPGQFVLTTNMVVEIEGEEKPALIAEWVSMQIC
ncbi:MAG: MaoC family dehydratase [Oceanicoccus sp.]|uniref:MaoC family dehydratase n=1 Tax=Oceanicoccus sp. TaxID=2691044 RepID=UPI00260C55EB|nr:MaoC family dehydratase [Oceanicoccus sp.]MCP3908200.1 MaoC family dehydratase [Oceanicoccus sp.]MDG1773519.1 MaoC family dehydratase [Oceanicoccus sp.]